MLSNTFYFYFVLGQPSKIIVLEQLNLWCKWYKVYFYLCIGHFYTVVVCKTWNKTKNFLQMTFIKYSININIRNECFFHPFQQSLTQIQFPNMTNSPEQPSVPQTISSEVILLIQIFRNRHVFAWNVRLNSWG